MEISSDKKEIMSELKELSKYYTPSADFQNASAGGALNELFCLLSSENRGMFPQLAERHRLLYLNMYGLNMLPALPASGYVKVTATSGGVILKKGTRLGGDTDAEFITESDLCVSDAELKAIYCSADNYIGECGSDRLFDFSGKNLQENAVYFSAEEILRGDVLECTVRLYDMGKKDQQGIAPRAEIDPSLLKWEYLDGNGEKPISSVEYKDGEFVLKFSVPVPLSDFNGITGRWIKITFMGAEYLPFVSSGTVELSASLESASPNALYFNDVMLTNADFLPFGEQPSEYDAFYIQSGECFGKKKSRITIKLEYVFEEYSSATETVNDIQWKNIIPASKFVPKPPLKKKIECAVWEYWNGRGWHRIFFDNSHSGDFFNTENSSSTIVFDCPSDMSETFVGADYGFFVRCRVHKLTPGYAADTVYIVPRISVVSLGYNYGKNARYADNVFVKRSMKLYKAGTSGVRLINTERHGCCYTYFCFDRPLPTGYVNICFRLLPSDFRADRIEWEALYSRGSEAVWKGISVGDKTMSFSESGIITFGIMADMAKSELFSQEGYWLRVYIRGKTSPAVLSGIYLNTVPIVQLEKMQPMYFTVPRYEREPEFALAAAGICKTSVKVLIDGEWTELDEKKYSVSAEKGTIRFDKGYEPPYDEEPTVLVDYYVTRGAEGNVPAGGVNRILDPIPFIDEITNPERTFGGRNIESFKECADRGKSRVSTLGRCVSAGDCEAAAKFADSAVVRAKALSGGGKITLVILTDNKDMNSFKRTRENVLNAIIPSMPFYLQKRLDVKPAEYIEISAVIYITSDGKAFPQTIHSEISEKLRRFLDPIHGSVSGNGYEIGEYPKPESIRALIMSADHVNSVNNLQLICRRGTNVFDYDSVSRYNLGVSTFGEPVIYIDEREINV